jgi:hypothetical protein
LVESVVDDGPETALKQRPVGLTLLCIAVAVTIEMNIRSVQNSQRSFVRRYHV